MNEEYVEYLTLGTPGKPAFSLSFPARNITVVSPDVGGVVRARALAKRLENAPLAIVDKRRERPGESEVMNIIGDVKGRCCILADDIIDSGGTLCNAAQALHPVAHCAPFRRRRCRSAKRSGSSASACTETLQPSSRKR